MTRGPLHKKVVLAEKVAAELNRKRPEPMTLLHKRLQEVDLGLFTGKKNNVTLGMQDKAASAMAAWDNSDPFAYGRTVLHLRQGYVEATDIIKEMGQRTLARRAARIKEVEDAKAKQAY
jgi:hypothetical protein